MYGNEGEEDAFVDMFNEINSNWRDYQAPTLSDCRYIQFRSKFTSLLLFIQPSKTLIIHGLDRYIVTYYIN